MKLKVNKKLFLKPTKKQLKFLQKRGYTWETLEQHVGWLANVGKLVKYVP